MSWGSFTNFYRIYENHLMAPIKLQILLQDLFAIKLNQPGGYPQVSPFFFFPTVTMALAPCLCLCRTTP